MQHLHSSRATTRMLFFLASLFSSFLWFPLEQRLDCKGCTYTGAGSDAGRLRVRPVVAPAQWRRVRFWVRRHVLCRICRLLDLQVCRRPLRVGARCHFHRLCWNHHMFRCSVDRRKEPILHPRAVRSCACATAMMQIPPAANDFNTHWRHEHIETKVLSKVLATQRRQQW